MNKSVVLKALGLLAGAAAVVVLATQALSRPGGERVSRALAGLNELAVADAVLVGTELESADLDRIIELSNDMDGILGKELWPLMQADASLERILTGVMASGRARLAKADELVSAKSSLSSETMRDLAGRVREEARGWTQAEADVIASALGWYRQALRANAALDGEALQALRREANARSSRVNTAVEELVESARSIVRGRQEIAAAARALRESQPVDRAIRAARSQLEARQRPALLPVAAAGAVAAASLLLLAGATGRRRSAPAGAAAPEAGSDAREIEALEAKINEQGKQISALQTRLHSASRDARRKAAKEMAATLVHELNTPITFIRSNLNSAAKDVSRRGQLLWNTQQFLDMIGGDTEEAVIERQLEALTSALHGSDPVGEAEATAELLTDCQAGMDQISSIVRSLDEQPDDEGEAADCTAKGAIDTALKMLQHRLEGSADVRMRIDEGRRLRIPEPELVQVLSSVLINAVEASDDVAGIDIVVGGSGQGALIQVRDDGRGMTEEELARALEPDFSTKQDSARRGLGLTVAARIVKHRGGRLGIASEPGKGTTVKILLPFA